MLTGNEGINEDTDRVVVEHVVVVCVVNEVVVERESM